jgi:hypothetical protein
MSQIEEATKNANKGLFSLISKYPPPLTFQKVSNLFQKYSPSS